MFIYTCLNSESMRKTDLDTLVEEVEKEIADVGLCWDKGCYTGQ